MADAIRKWRCDFCESENLIEINKELQICVTCGLAYPTKTMIQRASGDWLRCLPVEDLTRRIPKAPMGEMWIDPMGESFSRHDYINEYGIDPKINWEYRHKYNGANGQMRF